MLLCRKLTYRSMTLSCSTTPFQHARSLSVSMFAAPRSVPHHCLFRHFCYGGQSSLAGPASLPRPGAFAALFSHPCPSVHAVGHVSDRRQVCTPSVAPFSGPDDAWNRLHVYYVVQTPPHIPGSCGTLPVSLSSSSSSSSPTICTASLCPLNLCIVNQPMLCHVSAPLSETAARCDRLLSLFEAQERRFMQTLEREDKSVRLEDQVSVRVCVFCVSYLPRVRICSGFRRNGDEIQSTALTELLASYVMNRSHLRSQRRGVCLRVLCVHVS